MTGWIIFGGIILLIVLLLAQSVTVTVDYENRLDLKVKFLFFTLYPMKAKKKRKPKKAQKAAKVQKTSPPDSQGAPHDESEKNQETQTFAESGFQSDSGNQKKKEKSTGKKFSFDLEQLVEYVRGASPPLKRLFKKIRCRNLYIDYVVASDDAAKTAIRYGMVCAALYPVIEWLTTYFTVQAREIHVEADFSKEKDDVFAYCKLKLRLSTALGCVLWLGAKLLKTYLKYNGSNANPARA